MSSIGTGYDLSASQFSPDGRVFQVEYANKAVENSGTAVAVRCKDGVVFGVEKLVLSKLYEYGANKRIFHIDTHIGMAIAGLLADARQIVATAREEAANYRSVYGTPIPLKYLVNRVSGFIHAFTLYSAVRPFGCSVMLNSFGPDGPELYTIDPSGVSYGYHGCAIGKAKQSAKTEIEKLKMQEMSCNEVAREVAKIIYVVHDEVKDKNFELELSWIGEYVGLDHFRVLEKDASRRGLCEITLVTDGKHQWVPKDVADAAEKYAKESLEEESSSEDEDL